MEESEHSRFIFIVQQHVTELILVQTAMLIRLNKKKHLKYWILLTAGGVLHMHNTQPTYGNPMRAFTIQL